MNWIVSVGLPMMFVGLLHLLESLRDEANWRIRLFRIGWDLCVLALGMSGAVFAHPQAIETFGSTLDVVLCIVSLVWGIGAAALILLLRRGKLEDVTGRTAICSMLLGGSTLGLPSYVMLTTATSFQ